MATKRQLQHLKKEFLDEFRQHGNVSAAARTAGIDRSTVYRWQESDETFLGEYRVAEIEATEHLEHAAYQRAVEGVEHSTPIIYKGSTVATIEEIKYSDTLLIFLLKARAPEKYRENSRIEHTGAGGTPLNAGPLVPWVRAASQSEG